MTVSYVCGSDKGTILYCNGKLIGDVPELVGETVAMREALKTATQAKMDHFYGEWFPTSINAILAKMKVPKKIVNLVNDILILVINFKNVQFNYCKSSSE